MTSFCSWQIPWEALALFIEMTNWCFLIPRNLENIGKYVKMLSCLNFLPGILRYCSELKTRALSTKKYMLWWVLIPAPLPANCVCVCMCVCMWGWGAGGTRIYNFNVVHLYISPYFCHFQIVHPYVSPSIHLLCFCTCTGYLISTADWHFLLE